MPVPYHPSGCCILFSISLQGKLPLHLPPLNDFSHWVKFKKKIFANSNVLEKCGSDAKKQCHCYHLLWGVILQVRSCTPFWHDLSKYPCAWHHAFRISSGFMTAALLSISLELTSMHPSQHRVLADPVEESRHSCLGRWQSAGHGQQKPVPGRAHGSRRERAGRRWVRRVERRAGRAGAGSTVVWSFDLDIQPWASRAVRGDSEPR